MTKLKDTKFKKPYISQSQLNMYTLCAESYRRRYIEKEIIPPGFALVTGSGVHKGAEVNFKQKIETRKDLKESDVIDIATTEFEDRLERDGVLLSDEEKSVGYDKTKGKTKDKVVRMTKVLINDIAPKYQPILVEHKQRITTPNSDYDLLAILDLVDEDGVIADFKTSGRKKNQDEVDKSDQLSFYSLIYKAMTGELPKAVRLELVIDRELKTKIVTEHQTLESARKMGDLKILMNRINTMITGINKGVFMPCDKNNWKCNARWCGYYNTCKYV